MLATAWLHRQIRTVADVLKSMEKLLLTVTWKIDAERCLSVASDLDHILPVILIVQEKVRIDDVNAFDKDA